MVISRSFLILCFIAFTCSFCGNDDGDSFYAEEQYQTDLSIIEDYKISNNLSDMSVKSGVSYILNEEGNGPQPRLVDSVITDYVGTYLDGANFDSGENVTFLLGNLIPGWQIALPEFKQGSRGTLLIPSQLAYGNNPPSSLRANAVLRFDITLDSVIIN